MALANEVEDLIEARGEEVEARENAAVRTQLVLLHHLAVVDRIADVDVWPEWRVENGRIEVNHVIRLVLVVQVRVEALHQRRLASARHADDDARRRFFFWRRIARRAHWVASGGCSSGSDLGRFRTLGGGTLGGRQQQRRLVLRLGAEARLEKGGGQR